MRGIVYSQLRQNQRAIEDFNEAIRLKPDYAEAYGMRGSVYKMFPQDQRAIEDYNEAIRLKPDYAAAYVLRGYFYFINGDKYLGCRDAQKACKLGECELWSNEKGSCR